MFLTKTKCTVCPKSEFKIKCTLIELSDSRIDTRPFKIKQKILVVKFLQIRSEKSYQSSEETVQGTFTVVSDTERNGLLTNIKKSRLHNHLLVFR